MRVCLLKADACAMHDHISTRRCPTYPYTLHDAYMLAPRVMRTLHIQDT